MVRGMDREPEWPNHGLNTIPWVFPASSAHLCLKPKSKDSWRSFGPSPLLGLDRTFYQPLYMFLPRILLDFWFRQPRLVVGIFQTFQHHRILVPWWTSFFTIIKLLWGTFSFFIASVTAVCFPDTFFEFSSLGKEDGEQ